MVLHDITNDTELIEVAATAFSTEWLFERDLDRVNVIPVPSGAEELVSESQNQEVLHHLLAEIMINAEDFFFLPVWLQCLLKLSRRC